MTPQELERTLRGDQYDPSLVNRLQRQLDVYQRMYGPTGRMKIRPGGGAGPKSIELADTYNIVKEDSPATVSKSANEPSTMAKRIVTSGGSTTDWWMFIRWTASLSGWQRFIVGGKLYINNGSTSPVLINSGGPLDIAEAYVMTEDWDPDTLCWNNKPSLPAGAIDFQITTWVNASAGETEWDGNAGFMAMCWHRLGTIVNPDGAIGCAIKITSFSETHSPGPKDGSTEVALQSDGGFALVAF